MKVLLTGASGFLGQHVARELVAAQHEVTAIVRHRAGAANLPGSIKVIEADLRRPELYRDAIADTEVVVHLAAATSGGEDQQFNVSVVGTEVFLSALKGTALKNFIHVSSIVVYDFGAARDALDEETPEVSNLYEMSPYTVAKTWQERIVRETAKDNGWPLTVLRPGYIWSAQKPNIGGIGRSAGPLQLLFAPLANLPLTHVRNCAHCIAGMVDYLPAPYEAFNAVDTESVSAWTFAKAALRLQGKRKIIVPIPYHASYFAVRFIDWFTRRVFGPARRVPSLFIPARFQAQFRPLPVPNAKLVRLTGWQQKHPYEDCISGAADRDG